MELRRLFSSIALIGPLLLFAQDFNPDADEIFREDEVMEIRVNMSATSKEFLLADENAYSETYVPADVTFFNSELNNVTVFNVGIRLRGNTARSHPKKSYKIDFREFGGGQFENYKKINLKPNVNDPSVVRELLTMHMYRLMDVPAARIAPAALYFNDEYMGIYLMAEQVDDEFVDKRFGREVGWLYKCAYSATLEDNGQVYNEDLYESKMNEETDTRVELDHFVDVLNNTSSSDFQEEISKIFAVDRYIRQLAVEAITGHWDGYSYLNNNYYMYYDEDEGRFEFIVYDTDNTWGIDWIDRDWATRDLNHFHRNNHPRPLTSRILDVDKWQERYYGYLNILFTFYFNEDYLLPLFDQLENMLDPYVQADDRFDDSFGFTYQDFKGAFDYDTDGHVEYGLRGFLETRRSSGIGSIPLVVLGAQELSETEVFPNPSPNGTFTVNGSGRLIAEPKAWDLLGQEIAVRIIASSSDQVMLTLDAPSGVYFLMVNEEMLRVIID